MSSAFTSSCSCTPSKCFKICLYVWPSLGHDIPLNLQAIVRCSAPRVGRWAGAQGRVAGCGPSGELCCLTAADGARLPCPATRSRTSGCASRALRGPRQILREKLPPSSRGQAPVLGREGASADLHSSMPLSIAESRRGSYESLSVFAPALHEGSSIGTHSQYGAVPCLRDVSGELPRASYRGCQGSHLDVQPKASAPGLQIFIDHNYFSSYGDKCATMVRRVVLQYAPTHGDNARIPCGSPPTPNTDVLD